MSIRFQEFVDSLNGLTLVPLEHENLDRGGDWRHNANGSTKRGVDSYSIPSHWYTLLSGNENYRNNKLFGAEQLWPFLSFGSSYFYFPRLIIYSGVPVFYVA